MIRRIARLSEFRLFALNLRHGACRDEVLVRVDLAESLKAGLGACGPFINGKASWSAADSLGPHQNKTKLPLMCQARIVMGSFLKNDSEPLLQ